MLNKVLLVGNVVKKPELQTTKNDSKVVTLIVATNESYKK
jgi:single-stranded DNA-binding protein